MKIGIDKPQQNQCVLSIDSTKAFDRVEWMHFFQMQRKKNFPLLLFDMIKNVYGKIKAMRGVNGFLSEEISLGKGIRQGCPLSALLFIVASEPLLEILRRHQWHEHPMKRRVIAYADDVNVYVHANNKNRLFHEIKKFCRRIQFELNRGMKKILKTQTLKDHPNLSCIKVHSEFSLWLDSWLKRNVRKNKSIKDIKKIHQ